MHRAGGPDNGRCGGLGDIAARNTKQIDDRLYGQRYTGICRNIETVIQQETASRYFEIAASMSTQIVVA
jgi:hypothetical protein